MSKDFKIFGIRGSLLGDSLMSLSILYALERRYPGSYKYFQIAKKCAHGAPLYFNHPMIDKIIISDCDEGMGPKDIEIASKCQVVINVMPSHPEGDDWPNKRNIFEETFVMAGLPLEEYHSLSEEHRRPKLERWFDVSRKPKTIAIWPCAGYGRENKRNPSHGWYNILLDKLIAIGFVIHQYGHPLDYDFGNKTIRHNNEPFFDQIKATLGHDLVISTDSGSGLIFGAYSMRQITLLTNHWPNHNTNFSAFAPLNPNNASFFGLGSADLIPQDAIVEQAIIMSKDSEKS